MTRTTYIHEYSTIPTIASALFNGDRAHVFITRRADGADMLPSETDNARRAHERALKRHGVREMDAASQYSHARNVYGFDGRYQDRTRITRIETGAYAPIA
jgi:hypothetical protein